MSTFDNYAEALDFIEGGRSKVDRPVANNTRLIHRGAYIGLQLHYTDVIKLFPDGDIAFNSNGWRTVTTKDRMGYARDFMVFAEQDVWYIQHRPTVKRVERELRAKFGLPLTYTSEYGYASDWLGFVGPRGRRYGFWGEVGELIGFKEATAIYKAFQAELSAKTVYRFFDDIRFTKRGHCVNCKPVGLETS